MSLATRWEITCDVPKCPNTLVMDGAVQMATPAPDMLVEAMFMLGAMRAMTDGWEFPDTEHEGAPPIHYCHLHRGGAGATTPAPTRGAKV